MVPAGGDGGRGEGTGLAPVGAGVVAGAAVGFEPTVEPFRYEKWH